MGTAGYRRPIGSNRRNVANSATYDGALVDILVLIGGEVAERPSETTTFVSDAASDLEHPRVRGVGVAVTVTVPPRSCGLKTLPHGHQRAKGTKRTNELAAT